MMCILIVSIQIICIDMNLRRIVTAEPQMSVAEEEILRSVRRIVRAVGLYSRKLMTQTGLSGPQLICLRQLAQDGAMQTSHLAEAVNLSSATVCGILNRLERRGLVERERQLEDRRRVVVSLTDAGQDTVNNAPPALDDEQNVIQDTLGKLVSMMSAEDLDAAPILEPGDAVTPGPDTDE
jgi:DNA-binding MarR family transcriptional regulator